MEPVGHWSCRETSVNHCDYRRRKGDRDYPGLPFRSVLQKSRSFLCPAFVCLIDWLVDLVFNGSYLLPRNQNATQDSPTFKLWVSCPQNLTWSLWTDTSSDCQGDSAKLHYHDGALGPQEIGELWYILPGNNFSLNSKQDDGGYWFKSSPVV